MSDVRSAAPPLIEPAAGDLAARAERLAAGVMRPLAWRRLLLLPLALVSCLALMLLARHLALAPDIDARWRLDPSAQLQLQASRLPALQAVIGHTLQSITVLDPGGAGVPLPVDGGLLGPSLRWIPDDAARDLALRQRALLSQVLAQPEVRLQFSDQRLVVVQPHARGYTALGASFWLLCALGLALHLVAWVVLLVQPDPRNLLYTLVAQAQALQLVLCAVDAVPGLNTAFLLGTHEAAARMTLDLVTCAALVHAVVSHPTPLPARRVAAAGAWTLAAALSLALAADALPASWWWTQAAALATGLTLITLLGWSWRIAPHPFATVLRRFSAVSVISLALLTLVIALTARMPGDLRSLAAALPAIWTVFFCSLLLTTPFLARSQHVLREFAMLAGISTLAASVDLLFVAVFSLSPFASLTTSLLLALALYAGLRQWLLDQMVGGRALTTERLFEHLLRIARKVEQQPERAAEWQRELFIVVYRPLVAQLVPGRVQQARWGDGGGTLLVPLAHEPAHGPAQDPEAEAGEPAAICLRLRFAERGQRLFTAEDARLADRMVEQLGRAVSHDRAIELGRHEERQRLAQDLHDDIGARLLTLIYKSPDKETEDYVRHTLQDLKTLTRGLAANTHRLSDAAGEWKADIALRLAQTGCRLEWSFTHDEDLELGVVQWSALTRILRELVSNIIAHAEARKTVIRGALQQGWLQLEVSDDGRGLAPDKFRPGLGLGGIRKRVKQLGGSIEWRANSPSGVACEVSVPLGIDPGDPSSPQPAPAEA